MYLRIFTEGILGYRPIGFDTFELKPNLPNDWDYFEIKNIELCCKRFDIFIRNDDVYTLNINDDEIIINKGDKYIYTEN